MKPSDILRSASDAARELLSELSFEGPVSYVYNPLVYARRPWLQYIDRYADSTKRVVFLGMNPGPWGMVQTGVPFGEVTAVRDWLGIREPVESPAAEHPKRPVLGFACTRSEVSGRRLWGLFRERFGTAEAFFAEHFVLNYCPLAFLSDSGGNITPDKLRKSERESLFAVCDTLLAQSIEALRPAYAVGIGKFAERRLHALTFTTESIPRVTGILHPSPASPAANRGWAERAAEALTSHGVWDATATGA